MTKDLVAQRIRTLAAERGGHISLSSFLQETGINDHWLRGQPWYEGWNALLSELGVATKQFQVARTPRDQVAEAVARLIVRNGTWPTEDELVRERKRDASFPSIKVIRGLRRSGALGKLIVELAKSRPEFETAAPIAAPHAGDEADDALATPIDERVRGYVYMLRSGRRYKIGKSTDPSRRWREVKLELPEPTDQVHSIATDDPTGIEGYWHQRFAAKRVRNTEFFELSPEDVRAFKRRAKYQ